MNEEIEKITEEIKKLPKEQFINVLVLVNEFKKLQQDNQQLKEQLEASKKEYDMMFGLRNSRKLIKKFNEEFDKEDKIKNPNRDYACKMPDAEEVYKRYYDLKEQLEKERKARKEAFDLLQILHYNFPDYDSIHNQIEDIEKKLDINKGEKII